MHWCRPRREGGGLAWCTHKVDGVLWAQPFQLPDFLLAVSLSHLELPSQSKLCGAHSHPQPLKFPSRLFRTFIVIVIIIRSGMRETRSATPKGELSTLESRRVPLFSFFFFSRNSQPGFPCWHCPCPDPSPPSHPGGRHFRRRSAQWQSCRVQ